MTYFWPGGTPIKVEVNTSGQPSCVLWSGKYHTVDRVARVWLVDDRWWDFERIWRVYYRITTDSGILIVVFRHVLTGKWYLERLYD